MPYDFDSFLNPNDARFTGNANPLEWKWDKATSRIQAPKKTFNAHHGMNVPEPICEDAAPRMADPYPEDDDEPLTHLLLVGDMAGLERDATIAAIKGYMLHQYRVDDDDRFQIQNLKSRQHLWEIINSVPDSSLASTAFVGHGYGYYLPIGAADTRDSRLFASDFSPLKRKLFIDAPVRLFACNTAEMARDLSMRLNAPVWGNGGSTRGLVNECGYWLPAADTVWQYYPGGHAAPAQRRAGPFYQSYRDIPR